MARDEFAADCPHHHPPLAKPASTVWPGKCAVFSGGYAVIKLRVAAERRGIPRHFLANTPTVSRAYYFDHSLGLNRIALSREVEEASLIDP